MAKGGGQINDSFTCSHCKNDGFDAIRGAKDGGVERSEIYRPNGTSLGLRFNIQALQIEPIAKLYRDDAILLSVLNNLEGPRYNL